MILFKTPLVLCMLALILALHFLSVFMRGLMSKACAYVNIALHILLILPLLRYEFSIEEATLVYMISLFFYTLFAYVASKLEKNGKLSARDGDIKKLGESEDAV